MTPGIEHILPLLHHPEIAVVEVKHQDRQLILQRSGEFLNVHLDTAVTGHADHHFVRQSHFDPQRSR